MTSSMPIPKRRTAAAESSYSSSPSSSNASPIPSSSLSTPSSSKGKAPLSSSPSSPPLPSSSAERISPRRPSLLGSSLSKSEHTVINLGHEDGPPRLVTCVKSSQGFDWNQDLFLPSYATHDTQDLEHKPDPVEEIVLTDEEAAAMMPQ